MRKKSISEIVEDVKESAVVGNNTEILKVKKNKNKMFVLDRRKILIMVFLVLIVLGIGGGVFYYQQYRNLQADPIIEAQKETNRLVSILGKLMELPKNETPTIATISDREKLQDQAFFAEAQNGDVLFAYTNAMKAILYRPSSNKIINTAPININQSSDTMKNTDIKEKSSGEKTP